MILWLMIIGISLGVMIYMVLKINRSNYDEFCSYVLVLGARILDENTPCKTLEMRLICAANYLDKFKDSKVVVSGGKGEDEVVPEAIVMKNYLVKLGISEDRILIEDSSNNTFENLKNTKKLLGDVDEILVISSRYHLFRARILAGRVGFRRIHLIGSEDSGKVNKRNIMREVFAIFKSSFLDW